MRLAILLVLAACGGSAAPAAPDAAPDAAAPSIDAGVDAALTGCATSADCGDGSLCNFAPQHACGRDGTRGTCVPVEAQLCPDLAYWVCDCDGNRHFNQCFADAAGVAIDYGGPCRPAGVFVACTTSADCPLDPEQTFTQYCVDDPRDACDPVAGGTDCPGVCVHANQPCSDDSPCPPEGSHSAPTSPDTEACVNVIGAGANDPPGACVYTTRVQCAGPRDCGDGELCLPDRDCDPSSSCLGVCVRP